MNSKLIPKKLYSSYISINLLIGFSRDIRLSSRGSKIRKQRNSKTIVMIQLTISDQNIFPNEKIH